MKRIGRALVVVAMMVGAIGAAGCNKASDQPTQQDSAPVAQPTAEATKIDAPAAAQGDATAVVKASTTVTTRLPSPPTLRIETPGSAPSTRHTWRRGYWRWDTPTTVYVWVPGYWEESNAYAPYAPPAVRYEDPGYAPTAEYFFVPGFWRWSGREYVWTYGHWSLRRDAGFYYRPRWERVNGRWEPRMERWTHERRVEWEREHRAHEGRAHEARVEERRAHETRVEDRRLQERRTNEERRAQERRADEARRTATVAKPAPVTHPVEHKAPVVQKAGTFTPVRRGHG